jgi:hypothetical protein
MCVCVYVLYLLSTKVVSDPMCEVSRRLEMIELYQQHYFVEVPPFVGVPTSCFPSTHTPVERSPTVLPYPSAEDALRRLPTPTPPPTLVSSSAVMPFATTTTTTTTITTTSSSSRRRSSSSTPSGTNHSHAPPPGCDPAGAGGDKEVAPRPLDDAELCRYLHSLNDGVNIAQLCAHFAVEALRIRELLNNVGASLCSVCRSGYLCSLLSALVGPVYVCMCVCICIFVYVCVCVCLCLCMYVCTDVSCVCVVACLVDRELLRVCERRQIPSAVTTSASSFCHQPVTPAAATLSKVSPPAVRVVCFVQSSTKPFLCGVVLSGVRSCFASAHTRDCFDSLQIHTPQ